MRLKCVEDVPGGEVFFYQAKGQPMRAWNVPQCAICYSFSAPFSCAGKPCEEDVPPGWGRHTTHGWTSANVSRTDTLCDVCVRQTLSRVSSEGQLVVNGSTNYQRKTYDLDKR